MKRWLPARRGRSHQQCRCRADDELAFGLVMFDDASAITLVDAVTAGYPELLNQRMRKSIPFDGCVHVVKQPGARRHVRPARTVFILGADELGHDPQQLHPPVVVCYPNSCAIVETGRNRRNAFPGNAMKS